MCGRITYRLSPAELNEGFRLFDRTDGIGALETRYNAPPTAEVARDAVAAFGFDMGQTVVRRHTTAFEFGAEELKRMAVQRQARRLVIGNHFLHGRHRGKGDRRLVTVERREQQ